jgi:signal transduction histidine kinase
MIARAFAMLFFVCPLFAQHVVLKTYTRSSGIASDYVLCMYQDREGFIWFGTDRGVSRYDGHAFVTFTTDDGLGSNFVRTIFQDAAGMLWFGTFDGGVTRFDGKTFTSFSARDGFSLRSVVSIAQDETGRLFFCGDGQLVVYDHTRFDQLFSEQGIRMVLRTHTGDILLLREEGMDAIQAIQTGPRTVSDANFRTKSLFRTASDAFKWNTAVGTANGNVLAASSIGIYRLTQIANDRERTITKIADEHRTSCLTLDHHGSLWYGTQGGGLFRIAGNETFHIGVKQGLAKERVESLLCDYEGNLWIGTFGGGAQKLSSADLRMYTDADGLPGNDVTKIFLDSRRRLWVATEHGIGVIARDTIYRIPAIKEARGFAEDSQGRLYVGNLHSLFGPYTLPEMFAHSLVRSRPISYGVSGMCMRSGANAETLWVGSYGYGVRRFIGDSMREFHIADGLRSEMSEDVVGGSTGVWVLSRTVGATRYRDGRFESFTAADGIPSNTVHCVLDNGDAIWFGTSRGLARKTRYGVEVFNGAQGMKGAHVFSVFTTRDYSPEHPTLWVLTDKALHRFVKNTFEVFGSVTGFLFKDIRINAACFDDSTETMWLATTGGVVRIALRQLLQNRISPRITITDIIADTTRFAAGASVARTPLQMTYEQQNIRIGYAGLSFTDERSVRYRVKLSGLDDDWSAPMEETHISYRNLSPGFYTFSVVAINPDGVASDSPATFSFVIPPPFWKTWWFTTLAGVLLISAFGFVVQRASQMRLKRRVEELERERAVQNERERISRDLHDHVGAQLVNIISGLDLAAKFSVPVERRTERLLKSLQEDARASLSQLRETIWALKGQSMSFDDFAKQIESYARKQLKFHNEPHLWFDSTLTDTAELTSTQVLNCFRIVQEALTNCVKHAQAKNVYIMVKASAGAVAEIVVRDDGIGLRTAMDSEWQGNGIANMRKRVDEVGGTLSISQVNGRGTEIRVEIPLGTKH